MIKQKNLLRWCVWFFIGNCILYWLIGLNYLSTIPWLSSSYVIPKWKYVLDCFVVLSYLGQLGAFALIPILLVSCCAFLLRRRYVVFLAVILATFIAVLLLTDTIIYHLYRFHLNGVVFYLALHSFGKAFFDFSSHELAIILSMILLIIMIESVYAWGLWRFVIRKNRLVGVAKWFIFSLCFCLYLSYSIIAYSASSELQRILVETTRFLPFYTEIFNWMLPNENLARVGEDHLEHAIPNNANLHYPKESIALTPVKNKLNLVIVLIDAWRSDMLNPEVTPLTYQFAKKSWYFSNHFSGGNATGPGIFSLVYGLPSTYWSAMEAHQHGSVLVDELLKQHYQVGVFFSANLEVPAYNKTVFAQLKNLPLDAPGNAHQRDVLSLHQFADFIENADKTKQPFFSFIRFGSAHGYCSFNDNLKVFTPSVNTCNRAEFESQLNTMLYFNRYKNALYMVDGEVKKVIETLKAHHLLKNTVVIITGDHGEEFNDNAQGYFGHASNFTASQVKTPLVIYWPGEKSRVFNHRTSHYDVAPTLMKRMLGCKTPFSTYSIGTDLLDQKVTHPYLLVDSYIDLGILEDDRITRIFSTGDFQVEKLNSEPVPGAKLHVAILQHAFADMRRFYQ